MHDRFLKDLQDRAPDLCETLCNAYSQKGLDEDGHSDLCLKVAPYVADFIKFLFNVQGSQDYGDLNRIYDIKRQFVHRLALAHSGPQSNDFPFKDDLSFVTQIEQWLEDPESYAQDLHTAAAYARWACLTDEGQAKHRFSHLFKKPAPQDPLKLVPRLKWNGASVLMESQTPAPYDGLDSQCTPPTLAHAHNESRYCLYCHKTGKDSCRKGLKDLQTDQVKAAGCPLRQKISQMAYFKSQGQNLEALAVAMVDNPLLAATGHRICNDCKKACIYQKQEPVDIPSLESQILDETLESLWGIEIYSLLTRWNPLNLKRPYPAPLQNKKVLVVGMGPAGFTLSHYLLNEGIHVTGIDGAHIPPRSGFYQKPFAQVQDLFQNLEERSPDGLGGVMDYGITARWNKNYLQLIRLVLERHAHFEVYGGVRYGSTITQVQALENGYSHIALCCGAGNPRMDSSKGLPGGVHFASDFLMSLHQEGSFYKNSLVSFDYTLPAVVIGGGLTSTDTATQALIYYVRHVEKFNEQLDLLLTQKTFEEIAFRWGPREKELAALYQLHGKELKAERAKAMQENRAPHFLPLLNAWGGVTILYRKAFEASPAYRLNHEEVTDCMAQGVRFETYGEMEKFVVNDSGFVNAVRLKNKTLPAKSVFLALGTEPLLGENPTDKRVSLWGDLDPQYAGSVVKAMASAKDGYEELVATLDVSPKPLRNPPLQATLVAFEEVDANKTKLTIHAPMAAQNFEIGQFFRLKPWQDGLSRKAFTLSGLELDREKGLMTLMLFGRGIPYQTLKTIPLGSSLYCLGPLGKGTHLPIAQNVLILADSYGLTLSKALEKEMRARDCRVTCLISPDVSDLPKDAFDHMIVLGSAKLISFAQTALKEGLLQSGEASCAVGSPMQCAMQGICSRCVQKHYDPELGQEFFVYSCAGQDQSLTSLDLDFLQIRLQQNRLSDSISEFFLAFDHTKAMMKNC